MNITRHIKILGCVWVMLGIIGVDLSIIDFWKMSKEQFAFNSVNRESINLLVKKIYIVNSIAFLLCSFVTISGIALLAKKQWARITIILSSLLVLLYGSRFVWIQGIKFNDLFFGGVLSLCLFVIYSLIIVYSKQSKEIFLTTK